MSFIHNNKLYIHAGLDIKEGPLDDMWSLDLHKMKQIKMIYGVNMQDGSRGEMA